MNKRVIVLSTTLGAAVMAWAHDERDMKAMPHMVAKPAGPNKITLEMTPTPGIAANDIHMHALTLEFPDADHLTERWTNYTNGKPGETTVFAMTRVK